MDKNAKTVLLDAKGVEEANKAIIDQKGSNVYALDQFKDEYNAKDLKEALADIEQIEKDLYIGDSLYLIDDEFYYFDEILCVYHGEL